jgi:hypothetical protein
MARGVPNGSRGRVQNYSCGLCLSYVGPGHASAFGEYSFPLQSAAVVPATKGARKGEGRWHRNCNGEPSASRHQNRISIVNCKMAKEGTGMRKDITCPFLHIPHALRLLRTAITTWLFPARRLSEIIGGNRPTSESSGHAGILQPNIPFVGAVVSRSGVPRRPTRDLGPEWWMLAVSWRLN